MNRYGAMARRHWARWLPQQYVAIGVPEDFTTLGEDMARQIDELTDVLADDDRPGKRYLAQVRRLMVARSVAEEIILPDRVLPDPEPGASDDENGEPSPDKGRPTVVDRDHLSWAEVHAEQHERIHGPATD